MGFASEAPTKQGSMRVKFMRDNNETMKNRITAWRRVWGAGLFLCLTAGAVPGMTPQERVQFADGLYVRGLYDLALDEYLHVSRQTDDYDRSDMVLYRIGECHRRLDNPLAAERFYQRVMREYPQSDYAQRAEFRRAETMVMLERHSDAIALLDAFLSRNPPDQLAAPALYYRGYSARRAQRPDDAEAAYRTVLDKYPDSMFASYAALELAELYASQPNRAGEALALYERAAAHPATPEVAAEALFQKAEWYFLSADYKESATYYARLLTEYSDTARAREARLQAAWAYHNAGRHADGLALAETVLADPEDAARRPDWLYLYANGLRQLLRPDDARNAYAQLLEQFPDHPLTRVARFERALIAFRRDQFEEAIAEAEGVEPDDATRQDWYWMLAESYAGAGRDDEAVRFYRLVLDSEPDGERAPAALYRLGRLLQNRREYVQAARTFRELADTFPDSDPAPQSLFSAAFCMAMAGWHNDAVNDWEALTKRYPDHELVAEARYQRALTLIQLEQTRKARAAFIEFLNDHDDSSFVPDAQYWLSVVQEQDGDHADAEQSLRAALDADARREWRDRAQYRLALVLQRQEKDAEAADLMQELLEQPAGSAMPPAMLEWLTLYRLNASEYTAATRAAEALVHAADTPSWRQIGWALLGRGLQGQGKADEAEAAFEKSLQEEARTRDGAEAALYLGSLKLEKDEVASAVYYLERAAEWASTDALADVRARSYFGLAQAAAKSDDWGRAARLYMSVGILFDDPELSPESLYRAAHAFGQSRREEEQIRAIEELKERYPDSEWTEGNVIHD